MKIAVLGATGAVGRTMLRVLEERDFPADALVPLASARSAGSRVRWRGRDWPVSEPGPDAFDGCGIALFSAGAERSRRWGPIAAGRGAVVVDNSSAWRMHDDVPLVVPEVNAASADRRPLGIIANPNCSTIQMVVALEGLRRAAGLRRVVATTFQSVSGAGQTGLAALWAEQAGRSSGDSPFAVRIAGNVVPQIGAPQDDGWTEEELKMRNETRKILGLPDLPVAATCVRVPVEVGHAIAVAVETLEPLSAEAAAEALSAMDGIVVDQRGGHPVPIDSVGRDEVLVGRIRRDPDTSSTIHFWVVADNLRKGAATNAVQIAERLGLE